MSIITGSGYDQVENVASQRDAQAANNFFNALMADRAAKQLQSDIDQRAASNRMNALMLAADVANRNRTNDAYQQRFDWEKKMGLMDYELKKQKMDADLASTKQWDAKQQWDMEDQVAAGKVPADIAFARSGNKTPEYMAYLKELAKTGEKKIAQENAQDVYFSKLLASKPQTEARLARLNSTPESDYAPSYGNRLLPQNWLGWFTGRDDAAQNARKVSDAATKQTLQDKLFNIQQVEDAIAKGRIKAPLPSFMTQPPASQPSATAPQPSTQDPRTTAAWNEALKSIQSGWGTVEQANARLVKNGFPPLPSR